MNICIKIHNISIFTIIIFRHLQWGSYPVISINNDTFPNDMYHKRNHTIIVSAVTTYEPKTTAIVPVYGPEAGDWFVGAYLSHWDEKVQQQVYLDFYLSSNVFFPSILIYINSIIVYTLGTWP